MSHRSTRADREGGAALLLALIATVLLAALGLGLLTLTSVESRISSNTRDAHAVLYAADAGIERAVSDLRRTASWSGVLSGATGSTVADTTHQPLTPFGGRLDLDRITVDLNAASAAGGWGADTPAWRLFLWGPLQTLATAPAAMAYVAVWVSDDVAETDGDTGLDANGILTLHSEAFGPGGGRRIIDAVLARTWRLEPPVTGSFEAWPDLANHCAQLGCYDSGGYWPPGLLPKGTLATSSAVRLLSWRED